MRLLRTVACLLLAGAAASLHADDNARFDLTGPKVSVRVTRGDTTLPIAEVPNLQEGDELWVKADLPETQSNHLLLIVAFLRGTTNEPPDWWFTKIETWNKKKSAEGTTVVVPTGAEQALLFIAPETGGDFDTLRSAVKGKPGQFIRADADLNEASFEQQRIERYLTAMKMVPANDSKAVQDHSAKLAATLALKPNADCFKQPVEVQVNCLTQSSAPVILNDGHGESVAEALSTGPSSDFVNAASATGAAGGGLYSAYVGAVVDLVHLVSTLRTAKYQYIPGLSFPSGETMNLKLNAPPSFVNPKSVIVVGLPAIQKAVPPPLHPHAEDQVSCLLQPHMPLLVEGAPLVFSTSFAHDLVLHLNRTGAPTDLTLKPDAYEGGLVVTEKKETRRELDANKDAAGVTVAKDAAKPALATDLTVTGTIRGFWGFDPFEGPTLTLQQVDGKDWKVVGDTQLIAGQETHLTLTGNAAGCVQKVELSTGKDKDVDVPFKPADGDKAKTTLNLDVPAKKTQPGEYALEVKQYGTAAADKVTMTAYNGEIHLESVAMHAGDATATLTGAGLGSVASVEIAGETFTPQAGATNHQVTLEGKTGVSPADGAEAEAKLKDGRTMPVKVSLSAARPRLMLLSMKVTPAQGDGLPIALGDKDEIPLRGMLTFVVQTKGVFDSSEKIEVATASGAAHTTLSLADPRLVLQDEHTAIARIEPLKAFGPSAFGKLQMRPVAADGTTGDWTILGMLVRVPQITAIQCAAAAAAATTGTAAAAPVTGAAPSAANGQPATGAGPTCTVDGSSLFLVQSFSGEKSFATAAVVPTGFSDGTFAVPTPADGTTLYLKLRDDPAAVASVTLPTPVAQPAAPAMAAPAAAPAASAPAAEATAGAAKKGDAPTASGTAAQGSSQSPTPAPPAAATPTAPQQ